MAFTIEIDDAPPPSGFDIGQLVLVDPRSGATSERLPRGRCYMVYVELGVLLDQALLARINRSKGTYSLPDGSSMRFDGRKNEVLFRFPGLEVSRTLDATIVDLRTAVSEGLGTLVQGAEPEDPMILQFQEILAEIDP